LKPLIAIFLCARDLHLAEIQRATWLKDSALPYRFFIGRGTSTVPDDTVRLDVPDDYESLPFKTHGICQWARANGHTHIFKTDADSYAVPFRLKFSDYELHEYIGRKESDGKTSWANGGPGYWFGPRAIEIVAAWTPVRGREDYLTAQLLREHGIKCHHDKRYVLPSGKSCEQPLATNANITLASCEMGFDGVPTLNEAHRAWIRSLNDYRRDQSTPYVCETH
jgi:hypothetical protein